MLLNKKSLAADDETNKEQHATVSILTRCFDKKLIRQNFFSHLKWIAINFVQRISSSEIKVTVITGAIHISL